MLENYILDEKGNPVVEPDIVKWGKWLESDSRHLGKDIIKTEQGEITVSTVFLGYDHSWNSGPPVLWETMIFGSARLGEYQERYTSKEAAQEGHRMAVAMVLGDFSEDTPKEVLLDYLEDLKSNAK